MAGVALFGADGQLPLHETFLSTSVASFITSTRSESSSNPSSSAVPIRQKLYVKVEAEGFQDVPTHPQKGPASKGLLETLYEFLTPYKKEVPEGTMSDSTDPYEDNWNVDDLLDSAKGWTEETVDRISLSLKKQEPAVIPQYVLDYAPYVHLFSGESFWPCDIAEHLQHTTPMLNYTPIRNRQNITLDELQELNKLGPREVYLTSDDNVEERPEWLGGSSNIPVDSDSIKDGGAEPTGRSSAPAILIVVPKPDGVVDAFWFYFYSYNLGNTVFNVRFGNHVGDWEHTLVRFRDGEPEYVYLSEHSWGDAYDYQAMEKIGKRPLTFSAEGSHAMYATPGLQPYVLPLGLLHDETDRGPLWDPSLNFHGYVFNTSTRNMLASNYTPESPTDWLFYRGHWGDRAYPLEDKRQYRFAGQYHYVSGPTGPLAKSISRDHVCQGRGQCNIRHWLPPLAELRFGNDLNYVDDSDSEGIPTSYSEL